FRIAGAVEFAETEQGLVKAAVSRDGMTGELFLQGAQVTGWQPPGAPPVIFTSSRAVFAPGKAIRGGIPVIFPWFGPHPTDPQAAQHGWARNTLWQLDEVEAGGDAVTFALSLARDGFELNYRVSFGTQLHLTLAAVNSSASPMAFEEALHTYFAVSDVERISISGLGASEFIDKTGNMQRRPASRALFLLTKETDSVYLDVPARQVITDPGWGRIIEIMTTGTDSAIVWNPWPEKAAAMSDLGADNWRGFVCVETGNVADNRIHLPPGARHVMTTRIAIGDG
ncbi:MAG TPA: D-hexose-6-phosphate mutarotase, partial [Stellaceae bacterium]|nr:D-hexose-6-phosphate mutarotase [Stellaceae bacterium]